MSFVYLVVSLFALFAQTYGQIDAVCIDAVVGKINALRAIHRAPPVTINVGMNAEAQAWANHMNATKTCAHSNSLYGENVACMFGFSKNSTFALLRAVDLWYSENYVYDYVAGGFTAGHFTQLVWINSKEIGVGYCGGYIITYWNPPGNEVGQYQNNVKMPGYPKPSDYVNYAPPYVVSVTAPRVPPTFPDPFTLTLAQPPTPSMAGRLALWYETMSTVFCTALSFMFGLLLM